jgi:hypothetical protein
MNFPMMRSKPKKKGGRGENRQTFYTRRCYRKSLGCFSLSPRKIPSPKKVRLIPPVIIFLLCRIKTEEMESTEFMIQLVKQLMDTKKVAESTGNGYVKSLYAINGKKPFKNLSFLKDTAHIDEVIGSYAESTQRALLATLSSVLSLYKDKTGFKKVHQHYYDKMMEKVKEHRVPAESPEANHKNDKEKKNWVEWSEVEEKKKELEESVKALSTKKTLDAGQYEKLLQFVILSLYTDIPPRRNKDYLLLHLVKSWNDKLPTDKNYLDVANKKLVFNAYKTAKKYGKQEQEIPESLWATIQMFLKHHPLWKGVAKRKSDAVPFLVQQNGESITAVNAITRLLNKVFGKRVGSSLLRHSFLSTKYGDTLEEMKKDSVAMSHSLNEQKSYIRTDGEDA